MLTITDPGAIRSLAPMPALIEAVAAAFKANCTVPPRTIANVPGAPGRLLVCMPVFDPGGAGIVKTDSSELVVIGTGALAPIMALAHCAVRSIKRIHVWGRSRERAASTQAAIASVVEHVDVQVAQSLEAAVPIADIITCATTSPTPVLAGRLLQPGVFVDLVGSFSPQTREADDGVVRRSRIFVDTREGALTEAGDLLDPIRRGIIAEDRVEGSLADLIHGRVSGRADPNEFTLFKSVGTAIEDLAAARLIVDASRRRSLGMEQ